MKELVFFFLKMYLGSILCVFYFIKPFLFVLRIFLFNVMSDYVFVFIIVYIIKPRYIILITRYISQKFTFSFFLKLSDLPPVESRAPASQSAHSNNLEKSLKTTRYRFYFNVLTRSIYWKFH